MRTRDLIALPEVEKAALIAQVLGGQRLGGHHPDAEDEGRVTRLLAGELTIDEAYAELEAEYGPPEGM